MNCASLYVHIPFCIQKCSYCDFFSVQKQTSVENEYLECLINEAIFYVNKYEIDGWETIYIGGGTPSLLSCEQLDFLITNLKKTCLSLGKIKPIEFTIELNPETTSKEKLEALQKLGVNRISLGIQSLTEKALKSVSRHCSAKKALETLELVKNWQGNYNFDVIAGLPCQTDKEFCDSLKKIISYNPSHVSLYTLTIEENTLLHKQIESGEVQFDLDQADSQWLMGRDILFENGYMQYEVSNFCKVGKMSVHNNAYWQQKNYVGIGCGATGTFYGQESFRWTNTTNILSYESFWKSVFSDENKIPRDVEAFDLKTREFEFLMMGLRTLEGINSNRYKKLFNRDLEKRLAPVINNFCTRENCDGSRNYALTKDTILFLNKILVELLD